MSKQVKTPTKSSTVIANNDIVYLWWTMPEKIKDCLGFSIHRIVEGAEEPKGLTATVGFDVVKDKRKSPQTTDEWPIQSFNWKDLAAPHDKKLQYRIIPMTGTWDNLAPDLNLSLVTKSTVVRTQVYGKTKVIFNRGLLSTQALAKEDLTSDEIKSMIMNPTKEWRKRLGGQVIFNIKEFFKKNDNNNGKFYAALYELTDSELTGLLSKTRGNEIILSNANSSREETVDGVTKTVTINDGTNADSRKALHDLMNNGVLKVHDRMLGSHIGHNKFVIYVDKNGKPKSVLTGSTNWTSTGLCGQTNNLVIIDSPEIAKRYKDYWDQLFADKNQDAPLRTWCATNTFKATSSGTSYKLRFSPNTKLKNKPAKDPGLPVDIGEVFKLIGKAKKSILFLVFNPGSPSIIDEIRKVSAARPKTAPLFVRGAISDAKMAKEVTTSIYSTNALIRPDHYVVGDEMITGVAPIPGTFSYWEKELLKLGFATIHDKILVIDPFEKQAKVITGSHNLGYKASYTNDENFLIIENSSSIAQAYAAHVMDVVNHFKWRYRLQQLIGKEKSKEKIKKILESAWHDLDESSLWMDRYFKTGYIDQYRLFLP